MTNDNEVEYLKNNFDSKALIEALKEQNKKLLEQLGKREALRPIVLEIKTTDPYVVNAIEFYQEHNKLHSPMKVKQSYWEDDCSVFDCPAHTITIDEGEVISDKELFRYRVKLKIKKTMDLYNELLAKDSDEYYEESLGSKEMKSVSTRSNVIKKPTEDSAISKASRDKFIEAVEDIVTNQLRGLNRVIIFARYMDELSIDETYDAVKNYLKIKETHKYVKRTFYRHKFKAEVAFYKKIIKNIRNF